MPESAIGISVVIPVFNEAESLRELQRELSCALQPIGRSWEAIYVDDGSRDGSDRIIAELAVADPRVRGLSFRRNFGKSAALAVGFRAARGAWVVTMDADLQDDPSELPKLIGALESGYDLVSGWKTQRQDPITKTLPSRLFNAVTSKVVGIHLHDFNCGFKLYRREVVENIEVYGELHRFVPALAHWRGFRVGEVGVHHRPRRYGHSKFGAARFVNGFLDLLSAAYPEGGRTRVLSRRELRRLAARVEAWQDRIEKLAREAGLDVVRVGLDRWQMETALVEFTAERRLRKM